MRLTDLNPCFLGAGGEGVTRDGQPVPKRDGVGLACECPCGCGNGLYVAFTNPLDGGPPYISPGESTWERTGETFETLTLKPSIRRILPRGCGWHGFITNGEVRTC